MTTPPSADGAPGGAAGGAAAGAEQRGAVGAGLPPAGWYPGPAAPLQWWDGGRWWPPQPVTDNSVPLALLAHLGPFVGGFLVPLVVLLTEGKRTPFVKHHATEALNFQITSGIVSFVLGAMYVVGFIGTFAGVGPDDDVHLNGFTVLIVVAALGLVGFGIVSLVFVILASVRAGQRRYFRYPISIRFVRGAASRAEIAELERAARR